MVGVPPALMGRGMVGVPPALREGDGGCAAGPVGKVMVCVPPALVGR